VMAFDIQNGSCRPSWIDGTARKRGVFAEFLVPDRWIPASVRWTTLPRSGIARRILTVEAL
jgi:hypothetical protein